jgi:hypothetical protein
VVEESVDITPEPDEDERRAILAALAADAETRLAHSARDEAVLSTHDAEDGAPYPE